MREIDNYLQQNASRFEDELCQLLEIPSVSADKKYRGDVGRAADWVAAQFRDLGLETELFPTAGNPIVFAQTEPVPGAPVVLVYGHYDVQPADPLDEWTSPPFEPTRRNGNLYARGATDDKGQMFTHFKSLEAWLKTTVKLPVQLKFLIEGEEEVGSENLSPFLIAAKDQLACDTVVISDTSQFGPGQPAITYALRGIAYYELRLTGPTQDLHSGSFGGAVTNPANALCQILAGLVDGQGRVTIDGFYDDVLPLTDQQRRQMADLPFDDQAFLKRVGVEQSSGEQGYSLLERRWARPTYDINGLWSGYQGEGAKTVLPARAGAKFSFRLVANQDPKKIAQALRKRLTESCPPGLKFELVDLHAAPGVTVPLDSPYIQAAEAAIEAGFGKKPVYIREGGSIPIVTAFAEQLKADTLLLGWGLDDDNAHGPNEKFSLADFHRGIRASAYLWQQLGQLSRD